MKKMNRLGILGLVCWLPIPWLYFGQPTMLAGQPLSVYAVALFLGGVSLTALALFISLQKRMTLVTARSFVFLYVLALVAGYQFSGLAPSWDCLGKQIYVSVVKAQSGCTTTCTSNRAKPCSGWSSCWDKFVSCSSAGKDQDGRNCNGCCFSCDVVCPPEDPPSATGTPTIIPSNTPTPTASPTATFTITPSPTPTDTPSPTPTPLPPVITGQVECDLWGDAGWCRGNATLELEASDPQGFMVTIAGDLNGVPFLCGSTCTIALPEGSGVANYVVTSSSGRTVAAATPWKRDGTPPALRLILPDPDGRNGWSVSFVDVDAEASDLVSGVFSISGSVDGGLNWSPIPLHIEDGVQVATFRGVDRAGNVATITQEIRVDTVAPTFSFVFPAQGTLFRGNVEITGRYADETSGVKSGEVSFDRGLSWDPVFLRADNSWSFLWKTQDLPNGEYELLVRGTDVAGNLGRTETGNLIVDNHPPHISLTDHWWIWETGTLKVSANYFPVASIQVTLSDPHKPWLSIVFQLEPDKSSHSISWDRHFSDGVPAQSGRYRVDVVVCDVHDVCSTEGGVIEIPFISIATNAPALSATPTSTLAVTATAAHNTVLPSITDATTQIPVTVLVEVEQARFLPIWQLLGLIGLFAALALAHVTDPRPDAIRRLSETIRQIDEQDIKTKSKDKKGNSLWN